MRVLVTGGHGFLGRYTVRALTAAGYELTVPRHVHYDLTEQSAVRAMISDHQPQTVVHLAAACGGIGANGASDPMFGTSFATLKVLMKRINVDHELAVALWETGNFDARNLAMKIVDSAQMRSEDLDRWAREASAALNCGDYAAALPAEGPGGADKAGQWLASGDPALRRAAWPLVSHLAFRDELTPDAYFVALLGEIEKGIHTAPNDVRAGMNRTVITIGCRSPCLRDLALSVARRIGTVHVDHGDTACETPEAGAAIEKAWAHSTGKGFVSPAAQERGRGLPRRRC